MPSIDRVIVGVSSTACASGSARIDRRRGIRYRARTEGASTAHAASPTGGSAILPFALRLRAAAIRDLAWIEGPAGPRNAELVARYKLGIAQRQDGRGGFGPGACCCISVLRDGCRFPARHLTDQGCVTAAPHVQSDAVLLPCWQRRSATGTTPRVCRKIARTCFDDCLDV